MNPSVDSSSLSGSSMETAQEVPLAPREEKLYCIARADLNVGLRTAQAGHALIHWVLEHGKPPDNLVVLQVPDEPTLNRYWAALQIIEARVTPFFEPDLGDELTAVAVGPESWKLLSSLPLLR